MRTNFEHLKKYPELYKSAIKIEKKLLTAEDQEDMKQVGNSMRRLLEGLVRKMIYKYNHGHREKNLYSDCEMLYLMGAIDFLSWENMKSIMNTGNNCSHFGYQVSMSELRYMYKDLYEESYKIAAFYLTKEGYRAYEEFCDACGRAAKERRAKAAAEQAKKAASKPAVTPVVQAPVQKSVSKAAQVPVQKPVSKPVAKPVSSAPVQKPASKQVATYVTSTPAKSPAKKKKSMWGTIFAVAIWAWIIINFLSLMSF